jgi:Zn-dependent protease with chaperone function
MSERFDGIYFDGRSGRAHAVALRRIGRAHFALEGDGVQRNGAIAQLSVTPRLARVERTVAFADGARLQLPATAEIDAWFPRHDRLQALVDRLERHAHAVAAAVLVCLFTLAAGGFWGVPWAADRIAAGIPAGVEHSLGAQVLGHLDGLGLNASTLPKLRQDTLRRRFAELLRGLPDASGYRIEFRDAPRLGANAFALPGGTVVVTDQLVRLLHDEREIDAVVAHEIGHQQHRHALRQALRGSFVAVVAALFTGDVSSAGAVVIAVPTFLLDSHYSRGFESEADAFAFDLLARHDTSPHWFARAMEALLADQPDDAQLAYLSSHPPTAERIAQADAAGRRFAAEHPQLCSGGVCPGDVESEKKQEEDAPACDDCGEDGDGGSQDGEDVEGAEPARRRDAERYAVGFMRFGSRGVSG